MGLLRRIGHHFANNGIGSQQMGNEIATKALDAVGIENPLVRFAAQVSGTFAGSVVGGIRMINPISIIDTALVSEEEMDQREERIGSKDWNFG